MGMQISLQKPELERFVRQQVETGRYSSPEEVIRGALCLLQAHEDLSPAEIQHLRQQISIGINQAEQGDVQPWDPDEIAAEIERRHTEERKGI
jgi:antitoxin ParD1/3/4